MSKLQKYIMIFLSAIIVLYGLFYRQHFIANFLYKVQILKTIGFYFAILTGGYMAAYFIIEKGILKAAHAKKNNTGLLFPYQPYQKPVKAEEFIMSILNNNDMVIAKHGNITLKAHSLKVAELIASKNPSLNARLAALAHDIGKTMVAVSEYAYHDKLSFGMLNKQVFLDLSDLDRYAVLLAVKYHHDPYTPDNMPVDIKQLLDDLRWADHTATFGEKKACIVSDDLIYEAIRGAFKNLLETEGVINNSTDFSRLIFYYKGEVFAALEHKLRDAILNRLPQDMAQQIGATVERSAGQLHPAYQVIRIALKDYIVPSEKGLHNLKSGKKLLKGVVLFDVAKLTPKETWGEWPYDIEVLPWH